MNERYKEAFRNILAWAEKRSDDACKPDVQYAYDCMIIKINSEVTKIAMEESAPKATTLADAAKRYPVGKPIENMDSTLLG